MKKIFLLAAMLAVAVSFWGANFNQSLFQTVPVTVAQSGTTHPFNRTGSGSSTGESQVTFVDPNALPTIAPFTNGQPAVQPYSTIVAGESITRVSATEQARLDNFVRSVSATGSDQVTGVYVANRFSLPVMQQSVGDTSFVSEQNGTATQFSSPNAYGTIGLLAHNYLSGSRFFELQVGDIAVVVQGTGAQKLYRITQIERYQALSPDSVHSDFINLADPTQKQQTAGQVFQRIYSLGNRLVFQTCIEAYGDPSWGRIFIIAEKVPLN